MPSIFKIFHTIISRCIISLIIISSLPFLAIIWTIPRTLRFKSKIIFSVIHIFYKLIAWATLLPISYKGLGNIPKKDPAIIIANHQSALDIPLLALILRGKPHIWLARHELAEGLIIRLIIPLFTIIADVTNIRAAAISLRKILQTLHKTDATLLIFPEGRRFDDGQIHHFHDGFALIAQKTERPVIPVYIDKLYQAYPRNSWFITHTPITITIGPSFTIEKHETISEFKDRIASWFLKQADRPTP